LADGLRKFRCFSEHHAEVPPLETRRLNVPRFRPNSGATKLAMMSWHTIGRFAVGLSLILSGTSALAQNSSQISKPQTPKDIYGSIGTPDAQQTPIQMTPTKTGLPVKVFYEWPNLTGKFSLTLTLFAQQLIIAREKTYRNQRFS
jgi:hypothetical protein